MAFELASGYQDLHDDGGRGLLWFADQQMKIFWHDHVAEHDENEGPVPSNGLSACGQPSNTQNHHFSGFYEGSSSLSGP